MEYHLAVNDIVGPSCLHGGKKAWDKQVWEMEVDREEGSVTLAYLSRDGEEGYPGDVIATVTYWVLEEGIRLGYQALCSKPTIINMTNHMYFNLGDSETIEGNQNM